MKLRQHVTPPRQRPMTALVLVGALALGAPLRALGSSTSYQYDSANRLISSAVSGGTTTTYAYDGLGNLVRVCTTPASQATTCSDIVTDDAASLPQVIGEVATSTETLWAYVDSRPAAQRSIASGTAQPPVYPLLDHQASVRGLADASGNVVSASAYDAYGAPRLQSGVPSRLGFTGEWTGPEGAVWLRARHYDPALGRFLQRDDFPGYLQQPQSLNRHVYTEGNPVNLRDPSGRAAPLIIAIPLVVAASALSVGYTVAGCQNGLLGSDCQDFWLNPPPLMTPAQPQPQTQRCYRAPVATAGGSGDEPLYFRMPTRGQQNAAEIIRGMETQPGLGTPPLPPIPPDVSLPDRPECRDPERYEVCMYWCAQWGGAWKDFLDCEQRCADVYCE